MGVHSCWIYLPSSLPHCQGPQPLGLTPAVKNFLVTQSLRTWSSQLCSCLDVLFAMSITWEAIASCLWRMALLVKSPQGHCKGTFFALCAVCSVISSSLWPPMGCSPSGSSVHGIFQERIQEWVAISYSRRSSRPGMESASLALAGG